MRKIRLPAALVSILILVACESTDNRLNGNADIESALITAVSFTGEPGNYNLSVTIRSPDTGCGQYADWWEVVRPDGTLVYRKVLSHSHVNEQPFTRGGGPVAVSGEDDIIVRAHMNNSGYGEQAFSGSLNQGLTQSTVDSSFAVDLALADPLPINCDF